MASSPKRVYWDACVWIALIQKEKLQSDGKTEDREQMCRDIIEAAKKGAIEIATSTLSYVEVCKPPIVKTKSSDQIAAFFENEYILPINLDTFVAEEARKLMLGGYTGLKPPDAVHLTSAAVSDCAEIHTFDDALLALDGQLSKPDGTKLKICKPNSGGSPAPLLDRMQD